jgi:hypothetical protein
VGERTKACKDKSQAQIHCNIPRQAVIWLNALLWGRYLYSVERLTNFAKREVVLSQQLTRRALRGTTFYFVKDIVEFIFWLNDY